MSKATMPLKVFCKEVPISYITGLRWFKENKIPGAFQMCKGGRIMVPVSTLDAIECGGFITPDILPDASKEEK